MDAALAGVKLHNWASGENLVNYQYQYFQPYRHLPYYDAPGVYEYIHGSMTGGNRIVDSSYSRWGALRIGLKKHLLIYQGIDYRKGLLYKHRSAAVIFDSLTTRLYVVRRKSFGRYQLSLLSNYKDGYTSSLLSFHESERKKERTPLSEAGETMAFSIKKGSIHRYRNRAAFPDFPLYILYYVLPILLN